MRKRGWLVPGLVATAVLASLGCGGPGKTYKVSGTVTLEGGAPVPNALVVFIPKGENGRVATGTTDSAGQYELSTFRTRDGAMAGEYKITVKLPERASVGGNEMQGKDPQDPAVQKRYREIAEAQAKAEESKKETLEIHKNYADAAKTPLQETVPCPENRSDITLKKTGT